MGSNIATLVILSLLFGGAILAFEFSTTQESTARAATSAATDFELAQAETIIEIASVSALGVFRCDTRAEVAVDNVGRTSVSDFDAMDILTWYTPDGGNPVTTKFTYSEGNIEKGEWALLNITPENSSPRMWDPGEQAKFTWRFSQTQENGTTGYARIVTPNGVSDSDYVNFVDVTAGDCWFMNNNPTPSIGDTSSQAALPVGTGLPITVPLYNYDTDRDADPGLTLIRSTNGLSEIVTTKYQIWQTPVLANPVVINSDVLVDLWSALSPANTNEEGIILIYLRDYNGSTYTEIGEGATFARDWQSGSSSFVEKLSLIKNVNYTIPAGNQLEIRIVVDDASIQDMAFTYDTQSYSSLVNLSFVAPTPSKSLYLHNYPSPPVGDTARQASLSMDETAPAGSTIYQYGTPNNNDGLLLAGSSLGLAEVDPDKYQIWTTGVLGDSLTIAGDVFIDLWAGIRQFQDGQPGAATMYLRDYDGVGYTEIGNGSVFVFDWQNGASAFVEQTIMIPDIDYTIAAGHELEARLITDTIKASKDMWYAYDTTTYPTVIKLP